MDISTLIGVVLGLGMILSAIAIGGGGLMPFVDIPSVMIVLGGAFSALCISFPLKSVLGVAGVVKKCFLTKLPTVEETVTKFDELATIARRDGLLALENKLAEVSDSFMVRGLELVIGGTAKEEIQLLLETEVNYVEERHKLGKAVMDNFAAGAPAFGMIGTLIGLVQMLGTLDDPSKIGGGMAVALLTTLYGAVVANLFCIPLAAKLSARSKEEILIRELMILGMLSLVEGQTPRAMKERLFAFVSPGNRPQPEAQTAA